MVALATEGEGAAEDFCPWPHSCEDAFWDLFIRCERAGEGQKHFSGEESVCLWLVRDTADDVGEADAEGCV